MFSWKNSLLCFLKNSSPSLTATATCTDRSNSNVTPSFEKGEEKEGTLLPIPRFYFKKRTPSELKLRVRKEARTRFLEKKADQLLDETDYEQLWETIYDHRTKPFDPQQERLDYASYCEVARSVPKKAQVYMKPSTFLLFPRDTLGRISARALFRYIMRKVRLAQLRISLGCYDEIGQGFLREQDLENYVYEQIPSLPQLQGLEFDFYPYYVFTAVRKFIFFLDPTRKGKVKITDLMSSPILREFNMLRRATNTSSNSSLPSSFSSHTSSTSSNHMSNASSSTLSSSSSSSSSNVKNWFSAKSALEIYAAYLALDVDHNGMLSKREFMHYNNGSLSSVFVDRLFQEYRMYESPDTGEMEMDYKTFLDFALAMENKNSPEALHYFWKIFDLQHVGYITVFTLNYFFRAIVQKMSETYGHDVEIADVVSNEIFDMVKPTEAHKITLQDLIRARVGGTVVSILSDVNAFWKYDNREVLVHNTEVA
eukprot:TRINITY_DN8845_c0_g1_i1.p1 TRINITY_DN8845_c0_g1~~TRINITY_DN8845_c0_g1_i1.p1  ORF type:complete len:482 (+),score=107.63 TRINITY_DN8845_c0_g1_i1:19-1464(+)